MLNERKTEFLVREHFLKDTTIIKIEEQRSGYVKIDRLLATASKKGVGQGRPEFIISFKDNQDFLIVIECKADPNKHESVNKDKYSEYSVDGALLYASFLSKDFDVLAIGVSGQSVSELKVSHYLQLKGEKNSVPIFGDTLLPANDYLQGYLNSPEKFRQDYQTLLTFAKTLNDTLHTYKIKESYRSLLLSCILIALDDKAFRASYKNEETPQSLANSLALKVSEKLGSANISREKLDSLNIQFAFIKTDTSLTKKEGILRELIEEIDQNINQFIKTHEYFDVLGQLYIEFLKYANSDKGLGIVLTPPHITELFAELACVNKNSIIYDNCAGTGGFLISAMKYMIADAKGDIEKIQHIKSHQLFGTEYQSHIFPLIISNMYIHQDGKTNIFSGDCFDEDIISQMKTKCPDIGFLNPPYQNDKKKDIDELLFILNNLDCLVSGGTCIAIVPMQKALVTSGAGLVYKQKILTNHTLEAVFSMPDELFFNSSTSVVTCVMILTAHKPHPSGKKTYFGYYKDDGFIKRKIQKRHDGLGKWEDTKKKWVLSFLNRQEISGFSILHEVTAHDEWCAEAYMETDYTILGLHDFENTLLDYSSFLFANKLSVAVSNEPVIHKQIHLDTTSWQSFNLFYDIVSGSGLFNITGSKTTPLIELQEYGCGNFPYITTQATNNGTEGFYNYSSEKGNVITVDSAVKGYCSYQPLDFTASDHVEKLIPTFTLNKYIAMFLVTILRLEQYRYNYGRGCCKNRMKQRDVKLPAKNGHPDWQYMEDFIKSLPYSSSI